MAATDLIERFEAFSSSELFAAVREHLPNRPSRVLDIGAGTGRDAAWFAAQSHDVVAVEPVDALRNAGIARHSSPRISWIKDSLPALSRTRALGQRWDLILLCGVWQHLDDADRHVAFSTLRQISAAGCKVVMSLRHGPGAPTRPVHPIDVPDTQQRAAHHGFSTRHKVQMPSLQRRNRASGVTWTWLVLQAEANPSRDDQRGLGTAPTAACSAWAVITDWCQSDDGQFQSP
ncbi:MAG: methyltransferase domain-containing protein [Pseudomonadota bacterium]